MSRKQQHCLFVEDEIYNWANRRSASRKRLIILSLVFLTAGLLFGVLR
jgi:hypothetical protein